MIILVAVLLFFDHTSSLAAGCGTTLYQQSGTLFLPNNSVHSCQWRIIAGESEKIVLNTRDFNIVKSPNCELGGIEVYDGFWDTSPLLGRFCGSGTLNRQISSSNKMLVNYVNPNYGGTFTASYESVCGGALFLQDSTTLKSHESGLTYPNNKKCIWFIIVPDEYHVRLEFRKFRLEYQQSCLYDYVEVFDGLNQNSTNIGRFCGTQAPPPIISSLHSLQISFISDHSVNDEGFEVGITLQRGDCVDHDCDHYCNRNASGYSCSCESGYQLLPDGKSCVPICGGTLNGTYGSIQYSSVSEVVPRCVWIISAPIGHDITVEFFRFSIPQCATQTLEIFGETGNSSIHDSFCGNIPSQLRTYQTNVLEVVLTSRSTTTRPDFSLNYASFPSSCGPHNGNCHHQCDDGGCLCQAGYQLQPNNLDCKSGLCNYEISAPSGEFTSPGYPSIYTNNLNCTWSFRTTPGHTLAMNFSVIDLEPHPTCHYDHIKILDGPFSNSPMLSQHCDRNKTNGTLVRSSSNAAYVNFKTDSSNVGLGFRANYSSICGGNLTASTEGKYISSHDKYLLSNYYNFIDCKWIVLPKLGYRTKLTVETFHLENACGFDFVEISGSETSSGLFCGTTIPNEFESEGALTIRFRTDGSVVRKGFQFKYQAV